MDQALNPFARAAAQNVASALSLEPGLFTVSAPPKPEMGDFAVGCFPAAKALRQPPPRIATQVAAAFQPDEYLIEATAAGPFVNFRARRERAFGHLFEATEDPSVAALLPDIGYGQAVCIDYSSPNISKHLAYHHIRSTVIGHALAELYRALGYRVVGINHLGDWGTTHGMLLAAYHRWGAPEPLDITALNDLYVRFRQAMKEDPALEEEGRAWFKRLEDGEPRARELWSRFRDVSWAEFDEVYKLLGIEFEEVRGESQYLDDVSGVLTMLDQKGLLTDSQGAKVIEPPPDVDRPPMLLVKSDGATLYGTRDIAAALYRHDTYHFARSLYVTDRGQALHFRQLFDALERAGYDWAERCQHVPFGLVRLGGKKTGTRAGNVVLLKEVLAEAEERSYQIVASNLERADAQDRPEVDEDRLRTIARAVGIGAVVFANLVSQREKDMDFEWEQVLSTTGDSGPYIQYAHARCASIVRKAQAENQDIMDAPVDSNLLTLDLEWGVARKLLEFGEVVARATNGNEPHIVCRYLLDVCALFSRWYTSGNQDRKLRVLVDDPALSRARLALVAACQRILARGLALLGIDAPTAM